MSVIKLSIKNAVIFLVMMLFTSPAFVGDVKLQWDYPDPVGNALTQYRIRWGATTGGPYTEKKDITASLTQTVAIQDTVTGIKPGVWYFAVSALSGILESPLSNEVSATIFPVAPTNHSRVP